MNRLFKSDVMDGILKQRTTISQIWFPIFLLICRYYHCINKNGVLTNMYSLTPSRLIYLRAGVFEESSVNAWGYW